MRCYNTEMIKQQLNIREVLTHFGYDGETRRNIKCPTLQTEDKHPSAHIYDNNNICMCFSCGHPHNVIDITMAQTGLNFQGALDYLYDNFDLTGMYYDTEKEIEDPFPLQPNELTMIGLKPVSMPIKDYDDKPLLNYSIYSLYKDEKPVCMCMIAEKIQEAYDKQTELTTALTNTIYLENARKEMYEEKLNQPIQEIYNAYYEKWEKSGQRFELSRTSDEYKAIYSMITLNDAQYKLERELEKLKELKDLTERFPVEQYRKLEEEYTNSILEEENKNNTIDNQKEEIVEENEYEERE